MMRAVLILLATLAALADTVTTFDHLSVNGSLVEMSKGVIQLEVSSRAGKEVRWIPMSKVESIELNSTVFNTGGPPRVWGIKPPAEPGQAAQAAAPAQIIVLRGGGYKPCKLVGLPAPFHRHSCVEGEPHGHRPMTNAPAAQGRNRASTPSSGADAGAVRL